MLHKLTVVFLALALAALSIVVLMDHVPVKGHIVVHVELN
jgi:hypothetical protein